MPTIAQMNPTQVAAVRGFYDTQNWPALYRYIAKGIENATALNQGQTVEGVNLIQVDGGTSSKLYFGIAKQPKSMKITQQVLLRRLVLGAAVIASAIAATGCASASGPTFQGVADAPAGNGQVYLYRKPGPIENTSGTSYTVTLNKKEAGELYLGSFMQFVLPAGAHVFAVKPQALSKTYEQSVTVVENQTLFFEFEDPAFLLTNAFSLPAHCQA